MSADIRFSVFSKPWKTMPLKDLARHISELGFTGVEFPVRPEFQVEPEDITEGLPEAARIFADHGVAIESIAGPTDERAIAACAEAGVPIIRICLPIGDDGYLASEARYTADETGRGRFSDRVMAAMRAVPREAFVPDHLRHRAYDNKPLPIGEDQTISQPFIVALMTDLLDPEPGDRVLEVGTGCGYQAAVLAEVVGEVYSVEYRAGLGHSAAERLARLGYDNVHVRIGNGRAGWPEAAPFDGILVTAGAEDVPPALVEQLAPGGRLVIPVGRGFMGQDLRVVSKDASGEVTSESALPVAFVRLVD